MRCPLPIACLGVALTPKNVLVVRLRWLIILCVCACAQLQDMSVKVTTEVAEVEASKAPPNAPGQVRTYIHTFVRMVGGVQIVLDV